MDNESGTWRRIKRYVGLETNLRKLAVHVFARWRVVTCLVAVHQLLVLANNLFRNGFGVSRGGTRRAPEAPRLSCHRPPQRSATGQLIRLLAGDRGFVVAFCKFLFAGRVGLAQICVHEFVDTE